MTGEEGGQIVSTDVEDPAVRPEIAPDLLRADGASPAACITCRGTRWWRLREAINGGPGPWTCRRCHPPEPPARLIELSGNGGGQRG